MRKPSALSLRGVPVLSLALLSLAGCSRDSESPQSAADSSSPIAVDGAVVGGSAGMAPERQMVSPVAPPAMDAPVAMEADVGREEKASAQSATGNSVMARRSFASSGAGASAQRGDFTRGAPLPAIDVTGS